MAKIGLSIVIPLYNAKDWIGPTITHIVDSLQHANNFNAEIIVIDDGSSDGSADAARNTQVPTGVSLKVVSQKNSGRYLARKHGVELSTKDNILFIDSRVFIDRDSLDFLQTQLAKNTDQIWNGHVNIDKKGNIFARFWDAIVYVGWRRYFSKPKTTSYGLKDFDFYPKGTTMIYMPKKRLVASMVNFEETTNDIKFSSDDTLLIRYLAERQDIHLSPQFSCLYHSRSTFKNFLSHAYHRGQFFVDGFLRPGTRFFYPLLGVLVMSIAMIISLILWPLTTVVIACFLLAAFILGLFIGALLLGVVFWDAFSLAVLGAPFAFVYLCGIWRGVIRKLIRASDARTV